MKSLFDEIPRLESERLLLQKLEDKDADSLCELAHSENVYRFLPTFLFEQKYEDPHVVIQKLYEECLQEEGSLILGIFLKEGMHFCGLIELYSYKEILHKTCIGYRLLERYWGQGIASSAVALMVDYLFSQTDVEIITASTMIENHASERVLEKNGFIMTATSVPEDWGFEEPTIANKWFR